MPSPWGAAAAWLLAGLLPAGLGFEMPSGLEWPGHHASHSDEPESYCTPQLLSRYPGGWPRALDMGIYWFGRGDATLKAANGEKSLFYDPAKKTVIYFHGWTGNNGGSTRMCKRPTSRCPPDVCRGEPHPLLAERWLDDGWNVGFFYWDQFADEECTRDAEQKIWFDRNGDGFQWKSYDVGAEKSSYHVYKDSSASVADMCLDNMLMALGQFSGNQVRFVGHSIGAQLATRCAAKLHARGHRAAPQRLTLLEPYFSKHHLWIFRCKHLSTDSGLGDFTAVATAAYIRSLWDTYKVVTEVYKSSVMTELSTFGEPNKELERLSVLVEYEPDYCGSFNVEALLNIDIMHLSCRHLAVFPAYFLSYGQPAPPVVPEPVVRTSQSGSALRNCSTPCASCSDGQIRQWVERQFALEGSQKWVQATGSDSITSNDDAFELRPGLGDEAQSGSGGAANLLVMKAAMSDEDIFQETHHIPWWRDINSPRLHVLGVAVIVALLVLAIASCIACRLVSSSNSLSDEESDSEGGDGDRKANQAANHRMGGAIQMKEGSYPPRP